MLKDNILKIPHPVLLKPTQKVEDIESESETLSSLCGSMYETIKNIGAVGLAANQIGVDWSVAVARINYKPYFFVNPKIVEKSDDYIQSMEACLSIPNFKATLKRNREVVVEWETVEGIQTEKFIGYSACIVQHEIDHLNGLTILDHLPDFKRKQAMKKVEIWKRRNRKK